MTVAGPAAREVTTSTQNASMTRHQRARPQARSPSLEAAICYVMKKRKTSTCSELLELLSDSDTRTQSEPHALGQHVAQAQVGGHAHLQQVQSLRLL